MTPEKLQQEAEQLYPTWPFGKKSRARLMNEQLQAAHVACAEKYTTLLQKQSLIHHRAIVEKNKEIERLWAENERLKTPEAMREAMVEYYTWRVTSGWELHSSGDYYYRSKDRHQWPPEETCELHELFQHFLKDVNKANALKTTTP